MRSQRLARASLPVSVILARPAEPRLGKSEIPGYCETHSSILTRSAKPDVQADLCVLENRKQPPNSLDFPLRRLSDVPRNLWLVCYVLYLESDPENDRPRRKERLVPGSIGDSRYVR